MLLPCSALVLFPPSCRPPAYPSGEKQMNFVARPKQDQVYLSSIFYFPSLQVVDGRRTELRELPGSSPASEQTAGQTDAPTCIQLLFIKWPNFQGIGRAESFPRLSVDVDLRWPGNKCSGRRSCVTRTSFGFLPPFLPSMLIAKTEPRRFSPHWIGSPSSTGTR